MKSSIKTCLVKHKRIASLTKSTICTAVILSLAFTANLSAVPTIFLDADTMTTGNYPASSPLFIATSYGNITFVGEIRDVLVSPPDVEFIAVGASGNVFDILNPGIPGSQTAELFFDFDVVSIEFIYGGNIGSILIEARDEQDGVVASFYQDSTFEEPAGPETLYGSGIRSLYWTDTKSETGFAALDNITVTIPEPATILLLALGSLALLRRRQMGE